MSPSYRFSRLTAEWIDRIHKIEVRSFPNPWSRELIRQEFEKEVGRVFGLTEKETLLAYSVTNLVADELHILSIAVHPSCRGRGLGRELLSEILDYAQKEGALTAGLEVRVGNEAARRLYEGLGFHPIGSRPRYYSDGEDALIYELILPAMS